MIMLLVLVAQQWHPCRVTTYGLRPSGRSYHGGRTASGERYDDIKGWTVAVPPSKSNRHRPMIPYGTLVDVSWRGKTLRGLKVTDLCPGGTFDLTRRAMIELLGRYEDTTLKGARWRLSEK